MKINDQDRINYEIHNLKEFRKSLFEFHTHIKKSEVMEDKTKCTIKAQLYRIKKENNSERKDICAIQVREEH